MIIYLESDSFIVSINLTNIYIVIFKRMKASRKIYLMCIPRNLQFVNLLPVLQNYITREDFLKNRRESNRGRKLT